MQSQSVLGVTDFGPVGGTPLLPPSYLTVYFIVFVAVLAALYIYLRPKKPAVLWHKLRLLVMIASILKLTAILGILILAIYWLVPTPSIRRTVPEFDADAFSTTHRIEIVFDRPVARSEMKKTITPEVPGRWVFEDSIYTTHLYRKLVFYPTYSLRPDTQYQVNLEGVQNMIKISEPFDFSFKFKTQPVPEIVSVEPGDKTTNVPTNASFLVTLSGPNDHLAEYDFGFKPQLDFDVAYDADKFRYTLTPKEPLESAAQYQLFIKKTDVILNLTEASIVERGITKDEYQGLISTETKDGEGIKSLKRNDPLKVVETVPKDGWDGVNINAQVEVVFDQKVDPDSAMANFSIYPAVGGTLSATQDRLIFQPEQHLDFSTEYKVKLAKGVGTSEGKPSAQDYAFSFKTQDATTKLSVPAYLQKYSLSCEAAALRMALAYRGKNLSEDQLLSEIGFDTTPHSGGIWGNPYNAFVGNVRGRQMVDGYGVYWGPISSVANRYSGSGEFQNWSISELTRAVDGGSPVIVWVYSVNGTPTSWNTPDGQSIYAVRGEHAVVVVGFVGPPDDPTQIIVNDPLAGQVYWSRALFDKKWGVFGQSGVTVN